MLNKPTGDNPQRYRQQGWLQQNPSSRAPTLGAGHPGEKFLISGIFIYKRCLKIH
jgi:hypothetical protein